MRPILIAFVFWLGLFSDAFSAPADEYAKVVSDWTITYTAPDKKNPSCVATLRGDANSRFSIFKDLKDNELYIVLSWHEWAISDAPFKSYDSIIRFWRNGTTKKLVLMSYMVFNENTIAFRKLTFDFLLLMIASKIEIMMNGDIPDVTLELTPTDTAKMLLALAECVKLSPKAKGVKM